MAHEAAPSSAKKRRFKQVYAASEPGDRDRYRNVRQGIRRRGAFDHSAPVNSDLLSFPSDIPFTTALASPCQSTDPTIPPLQPSQKETTAKIRLGAALLPRVSPPQWERKGVCHAKFVISVTFRIGGLRRRVLCRSRGQSKGQRQPQRRGPPRYCASRRSTGPRFLDRTAFDVMRGRFCGTRKLRHPQA